MKQAHVHSNHRPDQSGHMQYLCFCFSSLLTISFSVPSVGVTSLSQRHQHSTSLAYIISPHEHQMTRRNSPTHIIRAHMLKLPGGVKSIPAQSATSTALCLD